jgi:hypothetical protein
MLITYVIVKVTVSYVGGTSDLALQNILDMGGSD